MLSRNELRYSLKNIVGLGTCKVTDHAISSIYVQTLNFSIHCRHACVTPCIKYDTTLHEIILILEKINLCVLEYIGRFNVMD